ncbi:hypothetical protein HDV00_000868 [Rhizophlyctis rosea]|nr:hypothetical protein HDV00_000868 [Rhizophlyctis rosea]
MPQLKLTYFPIKARAEPIRLALAVGGIPFEDERIAREQWAALKEKMPFGQMPILTIDNSTVLAQQHAILRYVGKMAGVYPREDLEQAKVDQFMCHLEDITKVVANTLHEQDAEKKKAIREELSATTLPRLYGYMERFAAENGTGYLVGNSLTVADLMLYCSDGWLRMGVLDHIKPDILDAFPNLMKVIKNVGANPKVAEWEKAHAK